MGDDKTRITNTNGTITIEITLPSEIKNAGTDFFIIRVHNGVATKLELKLVAGDTYSFETDRFSTYAIGYKTKASSEIPGTGEGTTVSVCVLLLGLASVGVLFSRKRRFAR